MREERMCPLIYSRITRLLMGVSFSGVSGDVPVAVLDANPFANVLYAAQLRDLLMRLAVGGLFRIHWSETIHKEWMRLWPNRADLSWEDLSRTRRLMDTALPGNCVEGLRTHIPKLSLPDPDDRHVLASLPLRSRQATS